MEVSAENQKRAIECRLEFTGIGGLLDLLDVIADEAIADAPHGVSQSWYQSRREADALKVVVAAAREKLQSEEDRA